MMRNVTRVAVRPRASRYVWVMAQQPRARFIDYTATPAWRNAVTLAAVAFALCHVTILLTVPLAAAAPADPAAIGMGLLHAAAVLLRFAAPLVIMTAGFVGYLRQRTRA
jgi:hypothetical protein